MAALLGGVPLMLSTGRRRPELTSANLGRRTQKAVIEREIVMRDGDWLVAKSQRLMECIRQLTE
jgi:hypothetical protein